jgi:phytoene synthase
MWSDDRHARPEDLAACQALLRGGSRSFYAAAHFLPAAIRQPATALYAFCRLADDAMDKDCTGNAGLAMLEERLDRIYSQQPHPEPADRALADVVTDFHIPRSLLDALLEGFAWDCEARQYETFAELLDYCARVAGTVGAMMAMLMNVRAPAQFACACDMGVAMQLTNICRDVGEDAANGRLYLPKQWMREAGIDPQAWLANPVFDVSLGSVVQRLLTVADELYQRAGAGVDRLPMRCRPGMHAARMLYQKIGHQVRRQGLDSVSQRAVVPATRKLSTLFDAMLRAAWTVPATASGPQLSETTFLVESASSAAAQRPVQPPWWDFQARFLRVLDLFERLERIDRGLGTEVAGS